MKNQSKWNYALPLMLSLTIFASFLTENAPAADKLEFDYPELAVTPRASERLLKEAQKEAGNVWTVHLPLQISGLATLTSGIMLRGRTNLRDDPDRLASTIGIITGTVWLAGTLALARAYKPYRNAYREVKKYPNRTKREQLSKERYAEEGLYKPARLANRLVLASVLTNVGASIYMAANAQEDTIVGPTAIISALVGVAPFFFPHPWKTVANTHERYKKRIYGPVASATVLPEPNTGRLAPGMTFSLSF